MSEIKIKKAKSLDAFMKQKFTSMGFEGEWLRHLGDATKEGSWFIIGRSGHGKTTYALKMAKYLTNFGRVAYNSIEEGESSTFQSALRRVNMLDIGNKFLPLDKESYLELRMRLLKHKSPDIIFIDSLQTMYFDPESTRKFSYTDYRNLIKEFPKKLFVIISKWEPSERLVNNIKHDSHIKISVENYFANVETSRYEGGGEMFDIFPER